MNKPTINIVYAHMNKQDPVRYETPDVKITLSKSKKSGVPNVAMNAYSIPNPTKDDSIILLEPICILKKNFDVSFLKKFKYVFSWSYKPFKDKLNNVVVINYPSWDPLISKSDFRKKWVSWQNRTNEIVFIANNKHFGHDTQLYDYRVELADALHRASNFKVRWHGNMPFKNKPWFAGRCENKHNTLTKVKFTVCTENSYDKIYTHNYLTEKYPHAILAGAVPLYVGCHNIDQLSVPKSYIDLRPHLRFDSGFKTKNIADLVSKIESYSKNDYQNFCKEVDESVNSPNGVYHLLSFPRVYRQMIKFLL